MDKLIEWFIFLSPILYLISELIGESRLKSNSIFMLIINIIRTLFILKNKRKL